MVSTLKRFLEHPAIIGRFLLVLLAVLLATCTYAAVFRSMWLDELITLSMTNPALPFGEAFEHWSGDVHPPLYYLYVHVWNELVGFGHISRLPNLLAVAVLIYGVWTFHRLLDRRQFLVFCCFFATSYALTFHIPEARSYVYMTAFSTLLLGSVLLRIILDDFSSKNSIILLLSCVILSITHYFGYLFAMALLLTAFADTVRRGQRGWPFLVAVAGVSSALMVAWLAHSLPQISGTLSGSFWIKFTPLFDFKTFIDRAFSYNWPLFALGVLAVLATARATLTERIVYVPALTVLVGVAVALAISLDTPIITPRNLLSFLPAVFLIVSHGVVRAAEFAEARLQEHGRALVNLALIAMFSGSMLVAVVLGSRPYEDWQAVGRLLTEEGCAEAQVLVGNRFALDRATHYTGYYAPKATPAFLPIDAPPLAATGAAKTCRVKSVLFRAWFVREREIDNVARVFGPGDYAAVSFRGMAVIVENGGTAPSP